MANKIGYNLTDNQLDYHNIYNYYELQLAALQHKYSKEKNISFDFDFLGKTEDEVIEEFEELKCDLDIKTSFCLLSSIESYLRIDYIKRAELKQKDPISKTFKKKYDRRNFFKLVKLEEDILNVWCNHLWSQEPDGLKRDHLKTQFGNIKKAYKYRHWIAHGRYWNIDIKSQFDILQIDCLFQWMKNTIPLISY